MKAPHPGWSNSAKAAAEAAAATLLYAVAAFLLLSPVFDSPWTALADPAQIATWILSPNPDIFMWTLSWGWHALTTGSASLYDANILRPDSGSLAAVFPLFGHLPIFGPLMAVSGSPLAAYQLNLLANLALSGGAVYALLRHWGAGRTGALFGGFVYGFCPARVYALAAPSLSAGQYLPLGLLFLDRAVTGRRWTDAGIASGLFIWQAATALAYCAIVPLVVCVSAVATAIPRSTRPAARLVAVSALVVTAAIAAMLAPSYTALSNGSLQHPVALTEVSAATYRTLGSVQSWRDFLIRPDGSGSSDTANLIAVPLFIGWTTLAYAMFGLAVAGRRIPLWSRCTLGLASAVSVLLALGPGTPGAAAFWDLLGSWVPATTNSIIPSHFGYVAILAISILAGLGVDRILGSLPGRIVPLAAAAMALLVSTWELGLIGEGTQLSVVQRPAGPPRIYSLLDQRPQGTLLELPFRRCAIGTNTGGARTMFNSTSHWRPTLNGFGILERPNQGVIDSLIAALPDTRAIEMLARALDLRHIIAKTSTMAVTDRNRLGAGDITREEGYADGQLLVEIEIDGGADLARRFDDLERQTTTLLGYPTGPVPRAGRTASARVTKHPAATFAGVPIEVIVTIRNTSTVTWPVLGGPPEYRVHIAHRWEDRHGETIAGTSSRGRTPLPFGLAPGESVTIPLCVFAPAHNGKSDLVVGVAQGTEWFGGTPGRARIRVGKARARFSG